MRKLVIDIPHHWLTWHRYQWIRFLLPTTIGYLILFAIGFYVTWEVANYTIQDFLEWRYLGFWLMLIPASAAANAFLGWNDNFHLYYVKRNGLDDLQNLLSRMDYFQTDHTEERLIYLKKTGTLRYKPAFIYLREGAVRLEITERYDGLFAPLLLQE